MRLADGAGREVDDAVVVGVDPRHQLREPFLFYIYFWFIYLLLFIVAQAGADPRQQLRELAPF